MTKREKQVDTAQKAFARILQGPESAKQKALSIHILTKSHKITGLVIYKGLSEIDSETPIVTIAYINPVWNDKIGPMTQIYYLVDTKESPVTVAQTGKDFGICGNCKHRSVNLGSCYVTLFQGVRALAKAYNENSYFDLTGHFDITLELLKVINNPIRFGAYGDPAAMPYDLQYQMAESVDFRLTGYTHQWNDCRFKAFKKFLHASVDTDNETKTARDAGWNYYKISTCGGTYSGPAADYVETKKKLQVLKSPQETICPNTASSGTVNCASCLKCSGEYGYSVINAIHGARTKKFQTEYN